MKNKILIDTLDVELDIDCKSIMGMFDSEHCQNCCESHYLDFDNFENDFRLVEDTLNKIDKIEIYGEEGMGITLFFYGGDKRVGIFIPGRGYNNGYYGTDLTLIVTLPNGFKKEYDIEEYQSIED